MDGITPLDRLATACGMELDYWDIWGSRHMVPDESKEVLLEAMGIGASDERAIEESLARIESNRWARVLGPVTVIREGIAKTAVTLWMRERMLARRWAWTLAEESGCTRNGTFLPSDLETTACVDWKGKRMVEVLLPLPGPLPWGYHRLTVRSGNDEPPSETALIHAPARCHTPAPLQNGRVFGPSVQVYALRSRRNWGIGDFSDLSSLVGLAGSRGARIFGINPIHTLFLPNPGHASPYSPSGRLFLNPLYLDIEGMADFAESESARSLAGEPGFRARLAALREGELVDYPGVAEAKIRILDVLYTHFRDAHLANDTDRARAFSDFRREGGDALAGTSLFDALQEHLHGKDPSTWGWPVWPREYRDPASPAVSAFAASNRDRIRFFQYLQWQADLQLGSVASVACSHDSSIGMYRDLPVSVDGGGAETWLNQDLFALGARVGAPPDDFNLKGQDWGLPPFIPLRLRETAYAPFIAILRANMRHAGALRIDHVMGLMRLFWVPPGKTPLEGAYVRYPFHDLLGILALESRRNRCLVIGEDLGTVPDEVRRELHGLGVLSCRIFYFERDWEGHFKAPVDFPEQALVSASTHDLPTLAGYWEGRDNEIRTALDLFPSEEMKNRQTAARSTDRKRVMERLAAEGLLPEGMDAGADPPPFMTPELSLAIHRLLARTPCKALMFQLEDVLGQRDQVNLPGTTDQYPNWRRKLPADIEDLEKDERFTKILDALMEERGGK